VSSLVARCQQGSHTQYRSRGDYDAIIIDLLDPDHHSSTPFERIDELLDAAQCTLADDGVLIAQIGAPSTPQGRLRRRANANLNVMSRIVRRFRADRVFVYDVFVPSFREQRSIVCVCRSEECALRWAARGAVVDNEISERVSSPTLHALRFFNGDIMAHFHSPSIPWDDRVKAAAAAAAAVDFVE
jgi:predicted membrane-bound spermidine synthase